MYKVVIVDDEPVIVKGLKQIINWEKFGCEVAGTAESGMEGMKLINELNPDILISDISMPGTDGLTMIAAIKSEHSDMQIAILTGYRDFDYAQSAIRLGVSRFLLKPSKIDEIEEAITAMTQKLDSLAKEKAASVHEASQEDDSAEESCANSFVVKNALDYIEENYQKKLKLSDVAEKIYVSQWHLSKLLNKQTGQNFSELLNSVRIEKAKEMLRDPALRIGDVAELVGFLDVAHFSRVFKKTVGISANEYRNSALTK